MTSRRELPLPSWASSATSSAEALRTFICYAGSKKRNIVGLDVSTAFLFADLDPDGRVVVRLPDGVKGRNGDVVS